MSVSGKWSSLLMHLCREEHAAVKHLLDLCVIRQEKYVETKRKSHSKYLYDKRVFGNKICV